MRYCKLEAPVDRIHERELNEMQSMVAHKELATAAAMEYCAEEEICPPP